MDYTPGDIASIVRVETSADLSHAKIFISVISDDEKVVDRLNAQSRAIRKDLASQIELRVIPNLHFILDLNESYADKMDELFKKI